MEDVKITAVKGFLNGNVYAKKGTTLQVSEIRARDLEANGLAVRGEKKAPEPQNKMAAPPANKSKAGSGKQLGQPSGDQA